MASRSKAQQDQPETSAARDHDPERPAPPSIPPVGQQTNVPAHATAPFHGRQAPAALPRAAPRALAVVSPKGGCGKTTISLNLSLSLARQGRAVVLIDSDANGDVLSAIDSRARAKYGFFDLLSGAGTLGEALLPTVLPGFKILPAVGRDLPDPDAVEAQSSRLNWLLGELGRDGSVVIVDTPAGMFGVTNQVVRACSHVIGVLQAEQIAGRSFARFAQALDRIPPKQRPDVLGVVVNMVQAKHDASLSVLQKACQDFPSEWLFDTSIPRHRAFLDASLAGVPLRHLNESAPPAVAWLFETLAAEITERLKLPEVVAQPQPLLV